MFRSTSARKKRTHDDWMSALPVEEIEHKEEQHFVCEICGAEMQEINSFNEGVLPLVALESSTRLAQHAA